MKDLSDYIRESLLAEADTQSGTSGANETIDSEKKFREFAKKKFETVFGDKLDVERMNFTIDGIIKNNQKAINAGDWGTVVGMLNKSFGHS